MWYSIFINIRQQNGMFSKKVRAISIRETVITLSAVLKPQNKGLFFNLVGFLFLVVSISAIMVTLYANKNKKLIELNCFICCYDVKGWTVFCSVFGFMDASFPVVFNPLLLWCHRLFLIFFTSFDGTVYSWESRYKVSIFFLYVFLWLLALLVKPVTLCHGSVSK